MRELLYYGLFHVSLGRRSLSCHLIARDFIKTSAGAALRMPFGHMFVSGQERQESTTGIHRHGPKGYQLVESGLGATRHGWSTRFVTSTQKRPAMAQEMVEARGNMPESYTNGAEDFLNLVARDDLDAVIVATPWIWHTPMAVAAMKAGKAVGVEVPAAVTVEQCWDLVKTSEETGKPCMLMENVCYRRDVMAVLNMVKKGMFGELIHCQCGYQHDLRNIKFQPGAEFGPGAEGEAVWRTEHSIRRNGEIYPTHGVGPIAKMLDINYGNRFSTLTSMATKSRGLHNYIVEKGGEDHPEREDQVRARGYRDHPHSMRQRRDRRRQSRHELAATLFAELPRSRNQRPLDERQPVHLSRRREPGAPSLGAF